MQVSKCCRDKIFVQCGDEGTAYYVCNKCSLATDPYVPANNNVSCYDNIFENSLRE